MTKQKMRFIITIICFMQLFLAHAQTAILSTYKELNDSVIARYNRSDFKGIYALGSDFLKSTQTESECIDNFQNNRNWTGEIVSTHLTEDLGQVKYFEWVGKNYTAQFELMVEDSRIKHVDITGLILQPGRPVRSIHTNNPLKSFVDSVVHKYALIYMNRPEAIGLSIGVYKEGKKYVYNYGEVKKGSGVLPTGNTIYQLGSVAKTFIGLLLAKAVADKKVDLQDDVRKYLNGEYPNLAYRGHPVHLVDLANHTGGFYKFNILKFPANFENWTWGEQMKFFYTYPKSRLIQDIHHLTLDTLPGSARFYSLGGIIILSIALENAYGKSLNELFTTYFGNVFHMKDTKLNTDPVDLMRFATPYDDHGQALPPMERSAPGLFSVKSTINDMLKYVEINQQEKDLAVLLSHKPTWGNVRTFSVGLTWQVIDAFDRGLWIFHTGHDAGYNSICSFYPNSNLGFVMMQNENGGQGDLFDMERNIFQNLEKR